MNSRRTLSALLTAAAIGGTGLLLQGQSASAGQDGPKRIHIKASDLPKPYATPSAANPGKLGPKPDGAELKLPRGFKAEIFADNFDQPRWVSSAPNGDIFVAEARGGMITVLRPGPDGKVAKRETFATDVARPFGIVFVKDWVYIGTPNAVVRYAYKPGQLTAEGAPETIASGFPTSGHWTRALAFNPKTNKMYVSIGSSKDVGEETEKYRATVCEFDLDGKNFRVYANGLRNAVGLAVHPTTGTLYASVQERDALGDDLVPDYVTGVKDGGHYGWPNYYIGNNLDPRMKDNEACKGKVLVPDVLLTSHTAAMCLTFYTGKSFPKQYQGDMFLALHGSGNRSKRAGYSVVRIPFKNGKPTGEYEDFVTGWMIGEDDPRVWGRPVGLTEGKDGALYLVDDGTNKVWRISYSK